jgi:hypothetical protein
MRAPLMGWGVKKSYAMHSTPSGGDELFLMCRASLAGQNVQVSLDTASSKRRLGHQRHHPHRPVQRHQRKIPGLPHHTLSTYHKDVVCTSLQWRIFSQGPDRRIPLVPQLHLSTAPRCFHVLVEASTLFGVLVKDPPEALPESELARQSCGNLFPS